MRRTVGFLIASVCLALLLLAFPSRPALAGGAYDSYNDFGDLQGASGWSYGDCDKTAGNCGATWSSGGLGYVSSTASHCTPAQPAWVGGIDGNQAICQRTTHSNSWSWGNPKAAMARRFTVQGAGSQGATITVTSSQNLGGCVNSAVVVFAEHGGVRFYSRTIPAGDTTSVTETLTRAVAGNDFIYFGVYTVDGSINCQETDVEFGVSFSDAPPETPGMAGADSYKEFSSVQGASGWSYGDCDKAAGKCGATWSAAGFGYVSSTSSHCTPAQAAWVGGIDGNQAICQRTTHSNSWDWGNAKAAMARSFVVPGSGQEDATITIASAQVPPSTSACAASDVVVFAEHTGSRFYSRTISAANTSPVTELVTRSLAAGDLVYFGVYTANGAINCQETDVQFTVTINDAGAGAPYAYGANAQASYSRDPVNLGTGSFTAHADDLALPGRAIPLAFTRWYNSADATLGPLGPGWTHTYNWYLTDAGATVGIRRGDGRRDVFTKNADGTYAAPPNVFDVLTKNSDGSYSLTLADQLAYEFSRAGRLTRIHDPAGDRITFAYAVGNLTTITDTAGRQVTLAYAANRLVQVQDPIGRKVTYAYDGNGRLVTVVDKIGNAVGQDPNQHKWQYAYDGALQHLTSITDPDGRARVTNTYDSQGRVVQQVDALSAYTTLSYAAGQTTITDPRGHPTTYTFDSRMRVLSQTDVVGANTYVLSYTYDAAGDRTSVTGRDGKTTDFTYDPRGNVLTKTDPPPSVGAARPVTTFAYDAKNNLTQVTDPLGFTTTLAYDPSSNVLLSVARQIDATTSAVTKYEYGDASNPALPTKIIAPRGNATATPDYTFATALAYDARGDLTSRTDPDGVRITFSYDGVGRLTSFVDPDGNAPGGVPAQHTWSIAYDENDRERSRTDPLGHVLSYDYDGAGQRIGITDRNGNLTFYAYDANARLATVRQHPDPFAPPTYTTTVTRDSSGNATRIAQANGAVTDYAFDALDRLTSVTTYPTPTTPLTTSYILDGNGQPTSRTAGDGVSVSYTYDALSRLTAVSGPSLSITYAYDAAGHRTSMTDATGTTAYQYDGLGRVTQIAAPAGTLAYAYDSDGDRTALSYPGAQAVTYAYSPGGRMTRVTDWASRMSAYTYTPSGLVSSVSFPNGILATYAYDRAQRLTDLTYTAAAGAVTLAAQHFTLDGEGDRTALDETALVQTTTPPTLATDHYAMTYDGLLRLTGLNGMLFGGQSSSETFTYDPATNLSARTGPVASYVVDGANRVTSDGARAFTWDGADRLTQRGTDTFAYDPLSRLTNSTVSSPLGPVTRSYAYDGDGLLRSRSEGTGTTSFLWDTSQAPAPLLAAGTDRVVQGLGPLYLARSGGSTLTLVRDALGSVRAEVTDVGVIARSFRYAAYGEIVQPGVTPTLLGFAGELRDPSGLIYLRARWYDSSIGRFISRDRFPGFVGGPASLNGYAYAAGRPTLLLDPLGLDPIVDGCGAECASMKSGYTYAGGTPSRWISQLALNGYPTWTIVPGPTGMGVLMAKKPSPKPQAEEPRAGGEPPPAGDEPETRTRRPATPAEADDVAQREGYGSVHELKKAYGVPRGVDITTDGEGNYFFEPKGRFGKGPGEPIGW